MCHRWRLLVFFSCLCVFFSVVSVWLCVDISGSNTNTSTMRSDTFVSCFLCVGFLFLCGCCFVFYFFS